MFGVSVPTFRLKRVSCRDSGIFFVIVECRYRCTWMGKGCDSVEVDLSLMYVMIYRG